MHSRLEKIHNAAAGMSRGRLQALAALSLISTSAIVASGSASGHDPMNTELLAKLIAARSAQATPEPAAPVTNDAPAASAPDPVVADTSTPATSSYTPSYSPPVSTPTTPVTDTTDTGTDTTTDPQTDPEPTTDPEPDPGSGRIKHVFLINLASPGSYDAAFGEESLMPYLAEKLRPKGQLLSKFSLLDENPLPNEVAGISGQRPNPLTKKGCANYKEFATGTIPDKYGLVHGSGCVYPVQALTIADELTASALPWRAYAEDQADQFGPGNCVHPDPADPTPPEQGGYDPRFNPFVFFHSLLDLGDCATNDVPFTELKKDLRKESSTPSFSYISPNLCNAGVQGQCADADPTADPVATAATSADAFLKDLVPQITKSAAYKNGGLVIITFSQAQPADDADKDEKLHVGTLLLSKYALAGSDDGTEYDPYSLMRSTAEIFGLDPVAQSSASDVTSFAAPLLGDTAAAGGGD